MIKKNGIQSSSLKYVLPNKQKTTTTQQCNNTDYANHRQGNMKKKLKFMLNHATIKYYTGKKLYK